MDPAPASVPGPRPRLAKKARLREDPKTGDTFLLYPERGLRLNATAAALVRLCDGMRSRAEIAGLLARRTGAPEAEAAIAADMEDFLQALADRGLLAEEP